MLVLPSVGKPSFTLAGVAWFSLFLSVVNGENSYSVETDSKSRVIRTPRTARRPAEVCFF
jgi:hypothetical protein